MSNLQVADAASSRGLVMFSQDTLWNPISGVACSGGQYHTCVVLAGGGVQCWGRGLYGRLGYGSTADIGDDETPASVGLVSLSGEAVSVSAGTEHSCAVLAGGGVHCWGRGQYGRLGYAI